MERSLLRTSAFILILLAGILSVSTPHLAHAQSTTPIFGVFSGHYNTANITDTSLVAGSKFAVQVNVTNAPINGWNGYEFALYYDQRYITATSYDIVKNTVFDPALYPSGGHNQGAYETPSSYNGPGAVRLSVVDQGYTTTDSGMLANITFTVVAVGVSPLILAAGMTQPGVLGGAPPLICPDCTSGAPNWSRLIIAGTMVGVETTNGYFSDQNTNSGPIASFTYSPASPGEGTTVTFNATRSIDPDNPNVLNHGIEEFVWDFGEANNEGNLTTTAPLITHMFRQTSGVSGFSLSGNFSIRLTVVDTDNGFQGMTTQLLTITPPASHCIEVSAIYAKSQVFLGDPENIQLQLTNSGTFPEKFNVSLSYGPPNATLAPLIGLKLNQSRIQSYSFNITTSNFVPAVYNIFATVTLYGNPNCSRGTSLSQFQVVAHPTGAAGLVLIGVVVVIAILGTSLAVMSKRRRVPEPP